MRENAMIHNSPLPDYSTADGLQLVRLCTQLTIIEKMNFSIEVEANQPLTIQTLYNVLASASSADPQQVLTGAQQLSNWEKQQGYYSSLQVETGFDFSLGSTD